MYQVAVRHCYYDHLQLLSCKLRGVHLCAPNTRHPSRCAERNHRVCASIHPLSTPRLHPICSAILASFLLNEELGHLGRVGCSLCLLGSLIIVLHAPLDRDVQTVDEILEFARQPGAHPYT